MGLPDSQGNFWVSNVIKENSEGYLFFGSPRLSTEVDSYGGEHENKNYYFSSGEDLQRTQ